MDYEVVKTIGVLTSAIIAVVGTLTNTLCLSYFIKKAKKTLPTRILMLLNTFDLAGCILVVFALTAKNYGFEMYVGENNILLLQCICTYCFEITGFMTVVLSVSRTIQLCQPFYQIDGKAIAFSFLLFAGYIITKGAIFYYLYYDGVNYKVSVAVGLVLMIVTVIIANTISAVKLLEVNELGNGMVSETSKHATVTVLILSIVFCVANSVWVGIVVGQIILDKDSLVFEMLNAIPLILVPLNSAINPAIYFWRKRAMREYARELFQNLFRMLDCKRADVHPGAEDSPDTASPDIPQIFYLNVVKEKTDGWQQF